MAVITFEQWKEVILKISPFKRSPALNDLNTAFEVYNQRPTTSSLDKFASALETWRVVNPNNEVTTLGTAGSDLQETITNAKQTNQVISVKASNVGQSQYYEIATPLDPAWGLTALPVDQNVPPYSPGQVHKINESFARARKAAELARDSMKSISAKTALGAVPTSEEQAYVAWFGAYDQTRAKKVMANYRDMVDAFDKKVQLYDVRNTVQATNWYAACLRARVTRDKTAPIKGVKAPSPTDQRQKVTNKVIMLMGRAFFSAAIPQKTAAGGFDAEAAYETSSDATIGTIIHEMAHGTFKAVDAPALTPTNGWALNPDLTPGDDYGATPDNSIQCSTPEMDKRLALKEPSIAICNADSYGQYARQLLHAAGKGQ